VASYGASNAGEVTPATLLGGEREESDDGDDRWGPPVGEGRERGLYRFGFKARWAGAGFFSGPNQLPKVQLDFYFFFPLFLFWISDLSL
jgi:hypothetical protein